MVKRLTYASALILGGVLAAVPAAAVTDFTANGLTAVAGNSTGLRGSSHALDARPLGDLTTAEGKKAVAAARGPAGWLLMLGALGFLGAMNRRSDPHPSRDELGL